MARINGSVLMGAMAVVVCVAVLGALGMALTHRHSSLVPIDVGAGSVTSGDRPPLDNGRMDLVGGELEGVGSRDPAFALVALSDGGTEPFLVYRTNVRSAVTEQDYRNAISATDEVQFRTAMLSRTQVDKLNEIVPTKIAWLADHGVTISSWGGVPAGGPYVIGYSSTARPPDSLLDPFLVFGPSTVTFQRQDQAHLG